MKKDSNFENEEWTIIRGFPNYMISNYGRVCNSNSGKLIAISSKRYDSVLLYRSGMACRFLIHRLVASHFIPGEDDGLVVNHLDGNSHNNHESNLEWCTYRDNNLHAVAMGFNNPGAYQKKKIRVVETGSIYDGVVNCAEAINGDFRNVYACLCGKRKTHRGYHFEYVD